MFIDFSLLLLFVISYTGGVGYINGWLVGG